MRVQRNERLGFVEPTKKIKRSGKTQEMTIARRGVVVTRGADLKPQKLQRVCHGRFFPEGKVSFIAGEPGLGKSQIAACMAAIVSAGADWPLHGGPRRHGDVIYISAEDGGADAIRSRLEAAGAHLPRVQIIEAINDELGRRPFNLVVDLDKLDEILRSVSNPRLVIVDPINACLGSIDVRRFNPNIVTQLRAFLYRLEAFAAKHRVAIVCVTHLIQAKGGSALTRVAGFRFRRGRAVRVYG
jgi:putative DNA primase/helicase